MLIGHVHFDAANAKGQLSELLALRDKTQAIFRNKYVKINGSKARMYSLGVS